MSYPATPILARLAFRVPPERIDRFARVYADRIVPFLEDRGLLRPEERSRTAPAGVFTRYFGLDTPAAVTAVGTNFGQDSEWRELLAELGAEFDIADEEGLLPARFELCTSPAGPGKAVTMGRGKGHWRTYDVADRLSGGIVLSMLQDGDGRLWFGTLGGGLNHYDGESFSTITTADGLANNDVLSIFEDGDGRLWLGTLGGLSLYDDRQPVGQRFTTFTVEDGLAADNVVAILQDRNGDMWFATGGAILQGRGISRYDGEHFETFTAEDGLADDWAFTLMQDRDGDLWIGTFGGGLSRYDGESFTNYKIEDGLPVNDVTVLLQDRDGDLWIGTDRGGLSRYSGERFETFTVEDGLADDVVFSLFEDAEGCLWIGTRGGLSRYDGQSFVNYDVSDGLANEMVWSLMEDCEGHLWIGTEGGGISRFSRDYFTTFTAQDGLPDDQVHGLLLDGEGRRWLGTEGGLLCCDKRGCRRFGTQDGLPADGVKTLFEDRDGDLWFAFEEQGLCRYDGERFETFTATDGLTHDAVFALCQDRQGLLWVGTRDGLSRYDGQTFTTFTTADGLAHDSVQCLLEDREGRIWIGTIGGLNCLANRQDVDRQDVDRQDVGKRFETFTVEDGLANNVVWSLFEDRNGHLWIATLGGGVSRYDGHDFQTLLEPDGLGSNMVRQVIEDGQGKFWFAQDKGTTRFNPPPPVPPPIFIDAVVAGHRYEKAAALALPASAGLIAFEFRGFSLKTRPGSLIYRYRLKGYEEIWRSTDQRRVEYEGLPLGTYAFEVFAIDRDLVHSPKPACVELQIVRDERDEQIDELEQRVRERTRQLEETHHELRQAQQALIDELEEELQTAHAMQMGLMPAEPPCLDGFDIAGRCVPVSHVGGDFFQYFHSDGHLHLAMADVTGHAMEAAIPVVMFNGILESQMELGGSLEDLFARLNRSMHRTRIDSRTHVCFSMGEVDLARRSLRLANSGCPYPYHYRAATGDVAELEIDAYPLGVLPDATYATLPVSLASSDFLIFCSDGIIEAENAQEQIFGFERTTETIRAGCAEGLSAELLIDRLIGTVKEFAGDVPQGDDMTVVVLKVEVWEKDE